MVKHMIMTSMIIASMFVLGALGFDAFVMGQSSNSSNQTSNQTDATGAGGSGSTVKMHIDEAIKALESNDNSGALMHLQEADKASSGQEKMHIDEAIKALESNDNSGALMHTQIAQQNL